METVEDFGGNDFVRNFDSSDKKAGRIGDRVSVLSNTPFYLRTQDPNFSLASQANLVGDDEGSSVEQVGLALCKTVNNGSLSHASLVERSVKVKKGQPSSPPRIEAPAPVDQGNDIWTNSPFAARENDR